jgi:type II secretion system protein C
MIRFISKIFLPLLLLSISSHAAFAELPTATSESIGIKIMGTIVAKTKTRNVVLVKEKVSGKVQAYREGHAILEKYRIQKIAKEYIIILKDNISTKVYQAKFANNKIANNSGLNREVFSDRYAEEGFERKGGKLKMTSAYRDKVVKQDMAKILMQATAQPYMKDGNIHGFQLTQIDADSLYEKGGFRDYDVITSINGIDLDSVSGAVKLLNTLKSTDSIDIVIERDGVEKELTLDID